MSCFLIFGSFFECFYIGFIVSNSIGPSPCNQNDIFFFCFTQYILFNGILKLIFNIRNACLHSIINFFSNLKITSKHLLISNHFLHMSDFGHVCEFLKIIRALSFQLACSDTNNKQYICWSCHHFIFIFHVFLSLSIINPFWSNH